MNSHRNVSSGFSLMEGVIATAIIGIFFVAIVSVFNVIGKAVMTSRTRTVATNLAQEKIEYLKNINYSRLRVTTASDQALYGYDNSFYPPEKGILVGDIDYNRRILVHRVSENASGALEEVLPDAGDTGLKKITVTVLWQQNGHMKSFSLSNVREDENRRPLDGTIRGAVREQGTLVPLAGAKVAIVDNLNWNMLTDTAGSYSLKVPTGTYQVNVTKDGYWPNTSALLTITDSTPYNNDVTLTKMLTGKVTGYIFINDHPVISRIVSSSKTVDGNDYEWVELYNPTTFPWTMSASTFAMDYIDGSNTLQPFTLNFTSSVIPSNGYYLISNTGIITANNSAVTADATYSGDIIKTGDRGGIVITPAGLSSDKVAWGPGTGSAPSNGVEGNGITSCLEEGKTHIRLTTHNMLTLSHGNAFDSDNNASNFWANMWLPTYVCPHNSSTSELPASGYPAYGAVVSCGDGVSSPTTSYMVNSASSRLAYFEVPNIATGTWTVSATFSNGSYSAYQEVGNVSILSGSQVTAITNAATSPAWPYTGCNFVLLNTQPVWGYAAGQVTSGGAGVGSIKVKAGTNWTFTSSNGYYSLPLEPGTYIITANPDNESSAYISDCRENIEISAGTFTSGVDFIVSPGGSAAGRVISNSGDYLPDINVNAYDLNGNEAGSAVTRDDGTYLISNLRVSDNNFTVKPQLDSSESSTPSSRVFTMAAGVTKWTDVSGVFSTFTVAGAYGSISGTATKNGTRVSTGVLIIASTATIGSVPPDITSSFRDSGTLYYGTVSHSDGAYNLQVRGGSSYNVYAWYTEMSTDGTVQTTQKYSLNNSVAAAGSKTVNFTWP